MKHTEFLLQTPGTAEEFEAYYQVRWEVLRKPWQQPPGTERDDLDKQSQHRMITDGNKVVAVGRLHLNSPRQAQIRYMAVSDSYRGMGLGTMILNALENLALEENASEIVLYARETAIPFYKRSGYHIVEKSYLLFDTIRHYKMMKRIRDF